MQTVPPGYLGAAPRNPSRLASSDGNLSGPVEKHEQKRQRSQHLRNVSSDVLPGSRVGSQGQGALQQDQQGKDEWRKDQKREKERRGLRSRRRAEEAVEAGKVQPTQKRYGDQIDAVDSNDVPHRFKGGPTPGSHPAQFIQDLPGFQRMERCRSYFRGIVVVSSILDSCSSPDSLWWEK